MAARFAIGFYALVALAVLVLAACGGSDDSSNSTPTPTPSLVATPTQTVSSVGGPCLGELPDGSVAIVGRVIDISRSDASVAPGFESMFVTVAVDAATSAADVGESYESGDALQVVLLGNLITEVDLGDCVAAAGETQRWACGPDCDAVGFVASFFEVLSAE